MASRKLCFECSNIPWAQLLSDLEQARPKSEKVAKNMPYHQQKEFGAPSTTHKDSLSALIESATLCNFCSLILRRFGSESTQMNSEYIQSPVYVLFSSISNRSIDKSWLGDSNIYIDFRCKCGPSQVNKPHLRAFFPIHAALDSELHQYRPMYLIQPDPTSKLATDVAKKWIQNCSSSHSKCSRLLQTSLPARILDVDSSDTLSIHLYEPIQPEFSSYIALSHCWGTTQTFTTTLNSVPARKKSIIISDLPQTFQDAVMLTRTFGYRYLWIDSLCIIQDCRKDWEIQSAQMGAIYNNASLVIAASRASSDAEGFLSFRAAPEAISLPIILWKTTIFWFYVLTEHEGPPQTEPIQTRAWTLQERYLARRTISYGSSYTTWSCLEVEHREDGKMSPPIAKNIANILQEITSPNRGKILTSYKSWYRLIEEYTLTSITKKMDRLPAITGLANAISKSINDECVGGIFLRSLEVGLFWSTESWHRPPLVVTRQNERAPSWSWVSVEGPVHFPLVAAERDFSQESISLATYCSHQTNMPNITTVTGTLTISAPLFPVKPIPATWIHWKLAHWPFLMLHVQGLALYIRAKYDFPSENTPAPSHILFLAHNQLSTFRDYYGILLRSVPKEGRVVEQFERVGIVNGWMLHIPYKATSDHLEELDKLKWKHAEGMRRENDIFAAPDPKLKAYRKLRVARFDMRDERFVDVRIVELI